MRRSQTFAGNVSEAGTLETMLQDLNAPPGALVVMDAGIATEANIQWLRTTGYGYLVINKHSGISIHEEIYALLLCP